MHNPYYRLSTFIHNTSNPFLAAELGVSHKKGYWSEDRKKPLYYLRLHVDESSLSYNRDRWRWEPGLLLNTFIIYINDSLKKASARKRILKPYGYTYSKPISYCTIYLTAREHKKFVLTGLYPIQQNRVRIV